MHPWMPLSLRQTFAILGTLFLLLLVWYAMQSVRQLSAAKATLTTALAMNDQALIRGAVADLETLHAQRPNDVHTAQHLAQGYMALDRPQDALQILEDAYRREPQSLLVQHELSLTYAALGHNDPALWQALGMNASTLLMLGDQHVHRGSRSSEALFWYQIASRLEPSYELRKRLTFAAALAGAPQVEAQDPSLIHHLDDRTLQVSGGELHWLVERSRPDFAFGDRLGLHSGATGIIWWSDHVGLLVRIDEPGAYRLSMQVRHAPPAPIEMALGVNGEQLQHASLGRGDGSAEIISVVTELEQGVHLLGVWYLNNAIVNGVDRDAEVDWVGVERVTFIKKRL